MTPTDPGAMAPTCTHIDDFQRAFSHPFSRPISELQEYEFIPGAWILEGFNVNRDDPELEDATTWVLIRYCPFCGASLYAPTTEPEAETPKVEVKPDAKKKDEKRPPGRRTGTQARKSNT